MRKDITIEKIKLGGEKVNKSKLARRYGCCWETIDWKFNLKTIKRMSVEFILQNWIHIRVL